MEELVLHFGMEGGGERVFRISHDGTIKFIRKYSYMKFDIDDWDIGEASFPSFELYWSKFTTVDSKWYRYHPVFVHHNISKIVLESLQTITKNTIDDYEKDRIEEWYRIISNTDI